MISIFFKIFVMKYVSTSLQKCGVSLLSLLISDEIRCFTVWAKG